MNWKVAADPLLRKIGLYSSYQLSPEEYVGDLQVGWLETLQANGYEDSPTFLGITLEAAKTHPQTGNVHDVSLRKVDPNNPWRQYHIHVWSIEGETECFSHFEYRPDFAILPGESLQEVKHRLQTHFRPEGNEYIRGKADPVVKELVE